MKGIILAAGKGSRLYPMTLSTSKALLPIYDKPLIYYPLSVLLQAGINDVLIIVSPEAKEGFERLFGDGSQIGIRIQYEIQVTARGIADAFLIGEQFIGEDNVCLILGDNVFYHPKMNDILQSLLQFELGAVVFGHWVENPRPFGVIEFDSDGQAISIEEKPENPKSKYIIPGLYFYDNKVVSIASKLKPSQRGELEITDINLEYLKQRELKVIPLNDEMIWFDTGTEDSMLEASCKIKNIQASGNYVGCIEEIAWNNELIGSEQLYDLGDKIKMTRYGQHLIRMSTNEASKEGKDIDY